MAHVVVGDRPGPRLITRCHVKEHELSRDVAILKILLASSLGALDEQVEPAERQERLLLDIVEQGVLGCDLEGALRKAQRLLETTFHESLIGEPVEGISPSRR